MEQEILARYCGELGGGVLMIGGAGTFDSSWQNSRLEQLLPVVFAANAGVQGLDRAFRIQLTDAALEHLGNASRTIADRDARDIAEIMRLELDGVMRIAAGDQSGGRAALARAADLEAKRPRPIARPYPVKPAIELAAEAAFAAGNAAGAVKLFQASLARTPGRAASRIGLARAAAKGGLNADAVKAAKQFLAAWHLADAARPEVAEAKRIAASPGP